MDTGQARHENAACLAVEGEMTIYRAAELWPALLEAVRMHDAPALDLSNVSEFDSAGLQLLLVGRQEAARLGKHLAVSAASSAVRDVFALLGMDLGEAAA